jgi:hypothetical protein
MQSDQDEPSAWLTLDVTDNDPVTLLADLTRTMAVAGMLMEGREAPTATSFADVLTVGVSNLAGTIDPSAHGILFLDQVDHLSSQSALDVVGEVLVRVAGSIRIAAITALPRPRSPC